MDEEFEMYKVVIIGESGTGKTNITTRYMKDRFNEHEKASVGVEFFSKTINLHGKTFKVTLWDTAGQERFKSLSKIYYKGARGVVIVYDITDPMSYLKVEEWMRLASTAAPSRSDCQPRRHRRRCRRQQARPPVRAQG